MTTSALLISMARWDVCQGFLGLGMFCILFSWMELRTLRHAHIQGRDLFGSLFDTVFLSVALQGWWFHHTLDLAVGIQRDLFRCKRWSEWSLRAYWSDVGTSGALSFLIRHDNNAPNRACSAQVRCSYRVYIRVFWPWLPVRRRPPPEPHHIVMGCGDAETAYRYYYFGSHHTNSIGRPFL